MTKRAEFVSLMGPADPLTGCREWQGEVGPLFIGIGGLDYAVFEWYGRRRPAVEIAWKLFRGQVPRNPYLLVSNTCGNNSCVSVGHLCLHKLPPVDDGFWERQRGRPAYPADEIAAYREEHSLAETMTAFSCSRATVYRAVSQK